MLSHSSAPVNIRSNPDASTYNPILAARPCARCHRRDGWRQIRGIGGGWLCCPSREWLDAWRDEAQRQCSPLCRLAGVA